MYIDIIAIYEDRHILSFGFGGEDYIIEVYAEGNNFAKVSFGNIVDFDIKEGQIVARIAINVVFGEYRVLHFLGFIEAFVFFDRGIPYLYGHTLARG